jgi:hypothetical protein
LVEDELHERLEWFLELALGLFKFDLVAAIVLRLDLSLDVRLFVIVLRLWFVRPFHEDVFAGLGLLGPVFPLEARFVFYEMEISR